MKKKFIFITIIILLAICILATLFLSSPKKIEGIDNYNKSYYIKEYSGDLDSNLSIFPDDIDNMIEPSFYSSLNVNLFDTDGYIILNTKYTQENFNTEIDRLSTLEMSISDCDNNSHTNYVLYDSNSYKYPAYISIDGFDSTYEYALIDEENLSITYIYLSYPDTNNSIYKKYLKNDKKEYSSENNLDRFSMYNHSFDNGDSWNEFNDC